MWIPGRHSIRDHPGAKWVQMSLWPRVFVSYRKESRVVMVKGAGIEVGRYDSSPPYHGESGDIHTAVPLEPSLGPSSPTQTISITCNECPGGGSDTISLDPGWPYHDGHHRPQPVIMAVGVLTPILVQVRPSRRIGCLHALSAGSIGHRADRQYGLISPRVPGLSQPDGCG